MFTVSPIRSAEGAAKYFGKEDNYYLSEKDAKEASQWWGEGAKRLNLNGKIEQDSLQNLLEGKLPNGNVIGLQKDGTINHRAGFDLCFSAPKSISILALDGGDDRLYEAHVKAVKDTLKFIEKDCAQAKISQNEIISFENTENLAVALIGHTTSRKQDLQLHTHCLVMNATEREDGKWRALASSKTKSDVVNGFAERIYNNQIYYGVLYKSFLASTVKGLGYEIENVGKHGLWEIKDVPKEARDIMSKRRKEIEVKIDKLGYQSLKANDIITLDTRDEKDPNLNLEEIKKVWRQELSSVGFSSQACIEKVRQRNLGQNLGQSSITPEEIKQNAKVAVQDAIGHLSQFNLKLDYNKLAEKSLEFAIGTNTHADISQALDKAIQNQSLIALDKNQSTFVTKELLETEKAILHLVENGKNAASLKIKTQALDTVEAKQFSKTAVEILESKDRCGLVEHGNMDGKELIKSLFSLAEASGKTVRILSPNLAMTHEVNQDIQRHPNSLWQWLVAQGKPEVGVSVAKFNNEYKETLATPFMGFRKDKDVVLVNSAEMLGNQDLKNLLELTEKSNAKVIFFNDSKGKQGVGAGNPIETLKEAGIAQHKVNSPPKLVNYIPELKQVKEDKARLQLLARTYAAKSDQERTNTLVLASSKAQLKSTNLAIREELKHQGKLSRIEQPITVLNPVALSRTESTLAAKYQKDMVVRIYKNSTPADWKVTDIDKQRNLVILHNGSKQQLWNPKTSDNFTVFQPETLKLVAGDKITATFSMPNLDLKNGSQFTVGKIDSKSLELLDGKKNHKFSIKEVENAHFDYNYATTLNKSAKKPLDHVLIDAKAYTLDKNTLESLQTRAKKTVTIFTNDAASAQKRFGDNVIKQTAAETVFAASQIDRMTSGKTATEIKSDIEKALGVLAAKNQATLAEKAVDFALDKISSRHAGFKHDALVTESLVYALNEQNQSEDLVNLHERVADTIANKQKSGELVMGQYFADGTRWTTKEALDLEQKILTDLSASRNKASAFLDEKTANQVLENSKLTQDQKNACHLITTSKDQFIMVQGYAGTGKTTMFSQVQNMLENTEILGLAPTHRAVKELNEKGIQAQTLKSFLLEKTQNPEKLDNKLLILDEASMVSNQDFAAFLDLATKSQAKVVLSGDIAQHISIEAGKPYEVAQRANILQTAYLKEIVRQKNPILKESVENVIQGKYGKAFANIESLDPKQYIARDSTNSFFDQQKTSIIAIDNNQPKRTNTEEQTTLEARLVEDYLSRTPETRAKTAVIVHANADRKIINNLIRDGLKAQGEIRQEGSQFNRLISKGLTNAEHKVTSFYNVGDVVKLGKNYHTVVQNDAKTKSILLQDIDGKTKYFYPEKSTAKGNLELHEQVKSELAIGDSIRLTKSDKERERYANFEYKVKNIAKESIILEQQKTQAKLTLSPENLQDAHWDYAHTVTGYGVQGASKTYAIDYEVSYRKNLANQRSFYIGASRAVEHLTIYTNNKDDLLAKIIGNAGDKYAALEVVGKLKKDGHLAKKPIENTKNRINVSAEKTTVSLQKGEEKDKKTFLVEGMKAGLAIKDLMKKDDVLAVLKRENLIKIETENLGQKVILCLKSSMDNTVHAAAQKLISAGKDVYIAMQNQAHNGKNHVGNPANFDSSMTKSMLEKAVSYTDFNKNLTQKSINNVAKNVKATNQNNGEIIPKIATNIHQKHQAQVPKVEQNKTKSAPNIERNLAKTEREIY